VPAGGQSSELELKNLRFSAFARPILAPKLSFSPRAIRPARGFPSGDARNLDRREWVSSEKVVQWLRGRMNGSVKQQAHYSWMPRLLSFYGPRSLARLAGRPAKRSCPLTPAFTFISAPLALRCSGHCLAIAASFARLVVSRVHLRSSRRSAALAQCRRLRFRVVPASRHRQPSLGRCVRAGRCRYPST
jgi:hypothetical protein